MFKLPNKSKCFLSIDPSVDIQGFDLVVCFTVTLGFNLRLLISGANAICVKNTVAQDIKCLSVGLDVVVWISSQSQYIYQF